MTCLWEDGVYLGVRGHQARSLWATRTACAEEAVEPAMGGGSLGGGQARAVESVRHDQEGGLGEVRILSWVPGLQGNLEVHGQVGALGSM